MKASGVVRRYPAGTPISGLTVSLRDESSPSPAFATVVTDANGAWSYSENGNQRGHWYWEATDTTVTPNVVRAGSSRVSGSGGVYALAEVPPVLRTLGTGVVRGYLGGLVINDLGTATNLGYATGAALIQGIPAIWHTAGTHAVLSTRDATNPRACYLVIEATMADGTVVMKDVCGTAAASPVLPDLSGSQNETVYQLPLYSFQLGASGESAANAVTALTDVRTYTGQRNPVVSSVARRTDPTTPSTAITSTAATGVDVTWTSGSSEVTLLTGVAYDIEVRASLAAKIDTGANTVQIAPYIGSTASIAEFVSSNLTDYAQLPNTHTLEGVVGTGAPVSCGLRIRVSGGSALYTTGVLSVICRPRS